MILILENEEKNYLFNTKTEQESILKNYSTHHSKCLEN